MDLASLQDLAPRTYWHRGPAPSVMQNVTDLLAFGTYVEPVRDPLTALVAVERYERFEAGAGMWLHVSLSRRRRLPSWEDIVRTRDALGYAEWLFVQIVAPRSAWLNVHPYCMHLWHRLGQDTVPRAVWDQQGADGRNYGQHR